MSRAWMPLYVADYLADTGHLTTAEHGAYLLLIMHYWCHGGLPDDDAKLARIVRNTNVEWKLMRETLFEFFEPGWKHKRIEAELKRANEKSEKAKASIKKRWDKPKYERNTDVDTNVILPQSHILSTSVDNTREPSARDILSECLSPKTVNDLIAHRQAKRAKLTPRAARELVKAFTAFGDAEAAAAEMILRGWTGFKPDWMRQAREGPPSNQKGGFASLLAKSMGLKNGFESRSLDEAVHLLPIDYRGERRNGGDDDGQLSGNIIGLPAVGSGRSL